MWSQKEDWFQWGRSGEYHRRAERSSQHEVSSEPVSGAELILGLVLGFRLLVGNSISLFLLPRSPFCIGVGNLRYAFPGIPATQFPCERQLHEIEKVENSCIIVLQWW